MNKKYELTNETKKYYGCTLHRIKALKDFGDVKKGDLGGWIEKEYNLSQEGNCWVYEDAKVFDDARISDNALVYENAILSDNAMVSENAVIYGNAKVYENAIVYGVVRVRSEAEVFGHARVSNLIIADNVKVGGSAVVSSFITINGNTEITHNAVINSDSDYMTFKNNWSSGRYFTYTKSNHMWKVGCFYGTGDELIKKAYEDSEDKGKHYELYVNLVKEQERLEE